MLKNSRTLHFGFKTLSYIEMPIQGTMIGTNFKLLNVTTTICWVWCHWGHAPCNIPRAKAPLYHIETSSLRRIWEQAIFLDYLHVFGRSHKQPHGGLLCKEQCSLLSKPISCLNHILLFQPGSRSSFSTARYQISWTWKKLSGHKRGLLKLNLMHSTSLTYPN